MTKLVVSLSLLVLLLIVLGVMHLAKAGRGATTTHPLGGGGDSDAPSLDPSGRVWGAGLMLTGGVGAFVMAATFLLPLVIFLGEMRGRDALPMVIATDLLSAGAWVCIGLGSFGGARRTNGYAIVVSVFAWLTALFALLGVVLMGAGGDTGQFFALVGFVAPFVAMLFFAIWGLAGLRGFGLGLGLPMGLCGILGSVAGTIAMMAIADSYRNMRSEAFKVLLISGVALCIASLVIGGVGLVGRLRRQLPASGRSTG